jgi:chromosomal replication initiator protein
MRELWNQTMAHFQTELPSHTFNTWLKPIQFKGFQNDTMVVEVPNRFYRDRLREGYADQIEKKLREITQNNAFVLDLVVCDTPAQIPIKQTPLPFSESSSTQKEASLAEGLNDRYTFASFVVGSSNQFAHAASLAVAESPARTYNPLFIYGGVGLGKTHLLNAIGAHIVSRNPRSRVVCRSAEQFMNELINAIRFEKTEDFRSKYRRSCEVLLLDDIHFLAGKERTQEEFFHTFNTLHQANRQIVVTSDQLPHQIQGLDERLRSRFQWGLLADIQAPDIETRAAILKKKAEASSVVLSDEVVLFLASQIKSNVRTLEGALVRLAANASLSGRVITLELAKELFVSINAHSEGLSVEQIQKRVAEFFNLNVSDLRSARRHKVVALPRQIAMYLARKLTPSSFPELGHRFGGKDHTTVMHGVQKIERLLLEDARLRDTLASIERSFVS